MELFHFIETVEHMKNNIFVIYFLILLKLLANKCVGSVVIVIVWKSNASHI